MTVEIQVAVVTTLVEAIAIRGLGGKPKHDWLGALGAATTANLAAYTVMLLGMPLVEKYWDATLQTNMNWKTGAAVMAWFSAFTVANAVELGMLQWIWKTNITRSLAIFISLTNAVTAAVDIKARIN